MALVITLSALALLSVLVLAFFSRAQCNRQISSASTSLLSAKSAARSALDIITGELRAEIADTTRSTLSSSNGVCLYTPQNSACLNPAQTGVASGTGPLVKVSAAGTAIRPGGAIQGSNYSISTPSLKGQAISADCWFTSSATSPGLGSQATPPTWLFLTRGNGVKTPDSVSTARNITGNDYVIGRFAYTVYDIGQLMDANVAGYPSLASSDASFKSSCAYADLTTLGLTSANVGDLLAWRNGVTGTSADTFKEWAIGMSASSGTVNSPAITAARSGHLSIVNGDNALLSRRDLLKHPTLGAVAGSLTHFARSVNAPSYSPATVTGTNPNLPNVRFSATASITHYQDDGTSETYTVQNGDFLLQRRFSLAKLAWITHTGPLAGISDDAIKACFGLSWVSGSNTWTYVGDGTGTQSTIKTLAQVAAANREPNFFELLQAGILAGSLGKSSGASANGSTMGAIAGADGNKAYQIIRIGTNIIDQARSDNYPTTIVFNGIPFYGIKDLPYFNKILFMNYASTKTGNNYNPPYHIYLLYELWNPHQAAVSSTGPTKFRVRINDEATYQYIVRSQTPTVKVDTYVTPSPEPLAGVDGDPMEFSADSSSADVQISYREPRLIRTGDPSTQQADLGNSVNAVRMPDIAGTYPTNVMWIAHNISHAVFILEYQDGAAWIPYSTFVGQDGVGGVNGMGGSSTFTPALGITTTQGISSLYVVGKADPRTFRFDAPLNNNGLAAADVSWQSGGGTLPWLYTNYYNPNFILSTTGTGYLSLLASNNANIKDPYGKSYPYADPDGVTRGGDAWYGSNPFQANVSTARPIVLNRPFRSVGELGYAFRDMPWKTLDLFTNNSADGALLDLFSLGDEPSVIAGKVNLNSQLTAVQQSLFSGVQNISNPATLASSLTAYSGTGPFSTAAALPGFIFSNPSGLGSQIKTEREAPVRALASSSQTRTWNLLIDVVAQTGRYTSHSATLNDFMVEGETRYWLSVAIDRYTGKIVGQQLENANEH